MSCASPTERLIVKDVNSGVDLAKMSERTDALALAKNSMTSLTGAAGILKEARLRLSISSSARGSPRSTICFSAIPSMRWSKMERRRMLAPLSKRTRGLSSATSMRCGLR